jgi:hypothetical protein
LAKLSARRSSLEGTLVGVALACLAFTKLNYFGVGMMCLALGGVLFAAVRRCLAAAALSLLAGTFFFLAFLRFNALAYWNDLTATCANVPPAGPLAALLVILEKNIPFLVLTCIPLAAAVKLAAPQAVAERCITDGIRAVIAALALLGMGLLVCSMNHQDFGVVTSVVATVALAEVCRRERAKPAAPGGTRQGRISRLAVCLATLLSFVPVLGADLTAIGISLHHRIALSDRDLEEGSLHSRVLSEFVSPARPGDARGREEIIRAVRAGKVLNAHHMVLELNDGIDLLRRRIGREDRVYCLDLDNLFPLALELPYAPRDAGWHENVGEAAYPDPEQFLRGITFVMQPKQPVMGVVAEALEKLFGPMIDGQFDKVDESELWIVWRRRLK